MKNCMTEAIREACAGATGRCDWPKCDCIRGPVMFRAGMEAAAKIADEVQRNVANVPMGLWNIASDIRTEAAKVAK